MTCQKSHNKVELETRLETRKTKISTNCRPTFLQEALYSVPSMNPPDDKLLFIFKPLPSSCRMKPWLSPARPHLRNPLSCRSGWEPNSALHVLLPCSSQTPGTPISMHGTSLEFSPNIVSFPGSCCEMDVFSKISLSFLSAPKCSSNFQLQLSFLFFLLFLLLSKVFYLDNPDISNSVAYLIHSPGP